MYDFYYPVGHFEEIQRECDTVEVGYNNEDVSSTTSDDFIVVSKVFDLDTPLDEDEIRRRLKCDTQKSKGTS